MDSIFTLRNEDLSHLNPEGAVAFFRQLLWAEAHASGIARTLIDVPGAITVADGGIDAEVAGVERDSLQGIIKQGLNRYQIKSGSFTPNTSGIKEILLTDTDALKPRIQSCLERDGRLVVVFFGWDNPDRVDEQSIVEKFRQELAGIDARYTLARIEVFRQNTLCGLVQPFPSLALITKGLLGEPLQPWVSWQRDQDMRCAYVPPPDFAGNRDTIQQRLRSSDKAEHVRILGEPGSGKTRFVLEATGAEDIAPLVLYTTAREFVDCDLYHALLLPDNNFNCVLVADECNTEDAILLWRKLANCGSRIKLITLSYEHDPTAISDTIPLDVPLLSGTEVQEILRNHQVPNEELQRWADFIGDSPRFAHLVGTNLHEHPDMLTLPLDNIYLRLLASREDPMSNEVKQRWRVLSHLALFKRIGYGKPYDIESRALAAIVERADRDVTWPRFVEIVEWFRRHKILQGNTTLYITPKLLHIRMWVEWWEQYGAFFDLNEFLKQLPKPSHLTEWFFEMFQYARESAVAQTTVARLLNPDGPFHNGDILRTNVGSRFFLALTEADPRAALRCLQDTIGRWSREELLNFTTGRRNILWALERIAIWKELFSGAARLLLSLGEAENETFANNASGMFADLFSPGHGPVAPTEASPEERFPVLQEALTSASSERRLLGLHACGAALQTSDFVRTIGAEYQGLRQQPNLWVPHTWDEIYDAYRRVWNLLTEQLDVLQPEERQQAVTILLRGAWGVIRFQNLAPMVMDTLEAMAEKEHIDKRAILKNIIDAERYPNEDLLPEIRDRLRTLKNKLTGSDFPALMKRYVGMDLWNDRYDNKGKPINIAETKIQSLAQQATETPALLTPALPWLVTEEAQNGYQFGYELGTRDEGFTLLPLLLEEQKKAMEKPSAYFLGGYLKVLFEKNLDAWEELMDSLVNDDHLRTFVPELTWRDGLTDRAALRVLNMARNGLVTVKDLRMFRLGGATRSVSEPVFIEWIEFLVQLPDRSAIGMALDLSHFYFLQPGRTLPRDLTFQLLTHPLLFQKRNGPIDTMEEFYWTRIATSFIREYPEKRLDLAEIMLKNLEVDGTIIDSFNSETLTVLHQITSDAPSEVWRIITKYLGPPIDSRAFKIKNWLQGGQFEVGEGVLSQVPLNEIWHWVDQDIEKRSRYLAGFVPKTLTRDPGKVCLAREVLIRYGAQDDVRRGLMANFSTEGWAGPASQHYQNKKEALINIRASEQNENVKSWIDEYVEALNEQIERAKAEEERQEF